MKYLPRTSTGFWIILFAFFALIVINFISISTYRQMQDLREETEWVKHTYNVIRTSDRVYFNILQLGISSRAYLLTRDEQYLKEIDNFKILVFGDLGQLKSLTSDNPSQQKRLETYDAVIKNRFTLIESIIRLLETNKTTHLMIVNEVKESSELTQQIHDIHDQINSEEQRLLKERVKDVNEHSKMVEFYTLLSDQISNIILLIGLGLLLYQLKLRTDAEDKLKHLAYHDTLTGLVNRSYLKKRVNEAIQIALRHGEEIAILFIDLDNFKSINDEYGHDVGDHVLKILSKRLLENVRTIDTVCRLGGDEFIVILSGIKSKEDVEIAIEKITTLMKHQISFENYCFFMTASIGVSVYPEDGRDHLTLIKNADVAMYRAKQAGGNNYQYYKL